MLNKEAVRTMHNWHKYYAAKGITEKTITIETPAGKFNVLYVSIETSTDEETEENSVTLKANFALFKMWFTGYSFDVDYYLLFETTNFVPVDWQLETPNSKGKSFISIEDVFKGMAIELESNLAMDEERMFGNGLYT